MNSAVDRQLNSLHVKKLHATVLQFHGAQLDCLSYTTMNTTCIRLTVNSNGGGNIIKVVPASDGGGNDENKIQ